ncbi:ATP phosphoribosyltransferase [Candidatus Cyanaurora vandensis]|uniref:ATP phosphoribosyltransferase n=1 Tax=Candidatus Cyanaurora vandensis TaxID=2714958 RepID=UPI00257A2A8C|nr:ATP phosphoribosyltransferase [Candidatus Cyanaurora vandensis]
MTLTLALPSKGTLYESTLALFKNCGLSVGNTSERSYEATIPHLANTRVLYQRPTEIPLKVEEATVDLGITGLDLVAERGHQLKNLVVLIENLGFGRAELVLAVPQDWIDVSHVQDLVDLSLRWRKQGRPLRIATKFSHLTSEFLEQQGLNHFLLVPSDGATEVAPKLGDADLIADTVTTGNTLRANGLRPIHPPIFSSQACLVAHRDVATSKLPQVAQLLDRLEAYLRAGSYLFLTAQTPGTVDVAPLIPLSMSVQHQGHQVSLVVTERQLYPAIQKLRQLGCTDTAVVPVKYFFTDQTPALDRLTTARTGLN